MAAMAALISNKVWFLFIALTVVVVVGSPTTDLLESVDCLLRDCVRYFTNAEFLYGGGPPLNLLYTIFHEFVYLLLTNGTPFTYLA